MDQVIASFRRSVLKMLGLLAAGVVLTSICAAMGLGLMDVSDPSTQAIGWAGAVFFGLCTVAAAIQLFRATPTVEVTTSGIRYRRRSSDLIPWSAISEISVGGVGAQRFLVLHLWPEEAARLTVSRSARLLEKVNATFGFEGIWISMVGLNGSLDDLIAAIASAHPELNGVLRS